MISTIIGEILIGWLIADLASGVFHWWEDRVPTEKMILLGKWLIAPNRLHHEKPIAFTEGSFLDRSLAVIVTTLVIASIVFLLFGLSIILVAATAGGMFVNEVHRYAHKPKDAPRWLGILQEIGLVQSARHHAGHHKVPSETRYCILTDWLNPILDNLRVWYYLETVLQKLGCKLSLGNE